MLEAALKTLFDYQRFERNPTLQGVIDEVLDRFPQDVPVPLADEDLSLAAGGVNVPEEAGRESEHDGPGTV